MVFQIFSKYPLKYQPYNKRLIDALKKTIPINVISLNEIDEAEKENFVTYLPSERNKWSLAALKFAFETKNMSFKQAYSFYLRYSYVIANPNSIFHFHNLQNINNALLDYMIEKEIKYVVSFRGYDVTIYPLLSTRNREKLVKVIKNAWKIHSVCKSLLEDAVKYDSSVKDKSTVIYRTPNVEDAFDFQPRQRLNGKIKIFTLSRVHWKKCVVESLISFKSLIDAGWDLEYHIIGGFEGYEHKRLLFLIHKLDIESRVIIHGFIKEESFSEVISGMDVCWLPTINEGLPNTLHYLLKSGVPCVASHTDGIPEVITHKHNGMLFNVYDFKDLRDKTEEILMDNDLRNSISSNSKASSLQKIDQEVKEYQKLYQD